jgi:hypothetical protein
MTQLDEGGGWLAKRASLKGRKRCRYEDDMRRRCEYQEGHGGACSWTLYDIPEADRMGIGAYVKHRRPTPHQNEGVVRAVAPPPAEARQVKWGCACIQWHPLRDLEVVDESGDEGLVPSGDSNVAA